jgi:hypothetical protein
VDGGWVPTLIASRVVEGEVVREAETTSALTAAVGPFWPTSGP